MIKRKYLEKITESLRRNPAVVLLGPRQVGKTTIALEVAKKYKDSVYLDLENKRDVQKLSDSLTYFEQFQDKLVIIDEVQTIPELFNDLRPAIDAKRNNGRFLLLGSASPVLVQGVSEFLTGRVEFIEIPPFTISEIPQKSKLDIHWSRGGFPMSFLAGKDSDSMKWRSSYIQSYSQMELSAIFGAGFNQRTVNNLWTMIAHSQGGLLNASVLAGSLGISAPTVKRYIDYLTASFHLRLLPPWHINAKKRMVKSPKIYIRDSGLLHSLLNIGSVDELFGHPVAGQSWEGYAIEQIMNSLSEDLSTYFYRTSHGAEVDLVIANGIKPVAAVEIKLSNSPVPSRGFYESMNDLKTVKPFVVSPAGDYYVGKNDVTFCGLRKFIEVLKDG